MLLIEWVSFDSDTVRLLNLNLDAGPIPGEVLIGTVRDVPSPTSEEVFILTNAVIFQIAKKENQPECVLHIFLPQRMEEGSTVGTLVFMGTSRSALQRTAELWFIAASGARWAKPDWGIDDAPFLGIHLYDTVRAKEGDTQRTLIDEIQEFLQQPTNDEERQDD